MGKKRCKMKAQDGLTGLYNKWKFFSSIQEILDRESEKRYMLICSDIKNFKLINEMFGFTAGDEMLKKIGQFLADNKAPGGIYARIESDKFGIFLEEQYGKEMIQLLSETEFGVDGCNSYLVHVNIGVYEITDKSIPPSLMYDRAIMALNTIKKDRRHQVAYFKKSMWEQMVREQDLYNDLLRGINNDEMMMYLQGLYNAEDKLVGAEVLARWKHPQRGFLPAGMFVEDLEKNGLIVALDQHIWELACRQLHKWSKEGREELFLAVNVSAKDFETIDICGVLMNLIKQYDILPGRLRIEITETALMDDFERNLQVIDQLRENGFIVEIDDFGTGYSALNMLKDISADVVKLDMKFLQKCKDEKKGQVILQTMIDLVKKLKMEVIVEGVETREQLELLKEYRCDVFQGYYLMIPKDVESFEEELKQQSVSFESA